MLAIKSWIVLLICMVSCIFVENCMVKNKRKHEILKEMISTQATLCSIPVKILKKENVTDYCDLWALLYEVEGLLEIFNFRPGNNSINKNYLIDTYKHCLEDIESSVKDAVTAYLQTVNMNPIEILERVNESLHKLDDFNGNSDNILECESYYKIHSQHNNEVTKGPQCACPSPTTPISSIATSQTSLSYLSEFASSTYTTSYSFHTSPLAEDMSHSYPEKLISPQKNSQGLDSSPVTFTDMPSDIKTLTTTMDHSHAGTTVQPGDYTDFPLTNPDFPVHSTEFTKGIHEPSYVSLNPSQTRTDQVNKETSNPDTEDMYESVVSTTIENPSPTTYSLINGEMSTVMEPDEKQETTMSEFGSQSSKGSVFQTSLSVPSKEPAIETSSNSVTKIRRSIENMDVIPRADVTTQAVSSLSPSANDPNLPSLNSVHTNIPTSGMILSNTEALEPVSQGKVIGDKSLGWASSYLSSTMLTTKTELSSAVPGGQLLLSNVARNPVSNAHKSYNIHPQQERDITIDDGQNSFSGPNHSSNMLPIIATEHLEDGRKKEHNQSNLHLIINVILVVLVLLFLCGLLYYRHRYWVLKRRLNISCDVDLAGNPGAVLHEERVHLPVIECDIV